MYELVIIRGMAVCEQRTLRNFFLSCIMHATLGMPLAKFMNCREYANDL